MTRKLVISIIVASFSLPAGAGAHVTLQPNEAAGGGFTRLNVRVPNERDDNGTVKVEVQMPPGFVFVSYEAVPDWNVTISKRKLATPVEVEGSKITEEVDKVTFEGDGKAGVIAPGQFRDFGLSVRVPEGAVGDKLTFKALQTYEGGEVVRWIGAPDADQPAPQVTLTAAGGGHAAAEATPAATADDEGGTFVAGEEAESGGSDTVSIIAVIVGGLGLLLGGAAFLRSAKRPAAA